MTFIYTFAILSLVARESKRIPVKCDMRKCRNWQTSKTKDLVSIALVWVQVPSSAFFIYRGLLAGWSEVLLRYTAGNYLVIFL